MNQGALHFNALLTTRDFEGGMSRIQREIREASAVARQETSKMDGYFKNLGIGISGYFSTQALMGFTKKLIDVRGEFQKTEIAFTTMLGSADKAKALMGQMVNLAAKTPFSLQDVSSGAKQLLAFQVPANEVVDTLTRMGNIAAGLGVPLSRINLVYGQVKAKGKLAGDDLRQFTEAGIPMLAELAKKFGKNTAVISEMVTAGKIGFKDVQDVLFSLTNEGGMFFNLMEKQSASLSGKWANLEDAFEQLLNKIGETNEGLLADGIDGLSYMVENYEDIIDLIKSLVLSYGAYRAALIVTAVAQSALTKTIQSEIAYLGTSQKWKLGRAIATQRQAIATLAETQAEAAATAVRYKALQSEVSLLAVKKQKAAALALEKTQIAQNAAIQLNLAQKELAAIKLTGSAREIEIAQKNVEKAQNAAIAAQDTASVARKKMLASSTQFYTAQKELENTAVAVGNVNKKVEAAQEAVVAAEKTANAIATTRLTAVQWLQVTATRAAAAAGNLLNKTIFANPFALATALLATLGYAIYKYASAATVAEESQKRMNDEINQSVASIGEQAAKINSLIAVIKNKNSTDQQQRKALEQIKTLSNGRLNDLTLEEVKTGKAATAIQNYIKVLKLEAKAKAMVNEMGKLDSDIEDLKTNRDKFGISDLWDDLTDLDSSFKWNLKDRKKERVDRTVQEKETQKKELQSKLNKLAKDGIIITDEVVDDTPEKVKEAGEKTKKEVEKIYDENTLKGLQQRVDKYKDIMEKAVIGSGTYNSAKSKMEAYQKKLDDLTKAQQKKSFDEQLSETKRQIEVRDKLLSAGYSKETVDAMFPQIKDQSFEKYLNDTQISLRKLILSGKGSDETAQQLSLITDELDKWKGYDSYIDSVSKSIDEFKNKYKGAELINRLEVYGNSEVGNETENELNAKKIATQKAIEEAKEEWKKYYKSLLDEQKSYEEKSAELQKEYAEVKKSDEYKNGSDSDRKKIDTSFNSRQGSLDMDMIQKTKEWEYAFSELEGMSNNSLQRILSKLLEFQQKSKGTLSLQDAAKLQEAIDKVKDAANSNPFQKVISSFTQYRDAVKNAKTSQQQYVSAQEKYNDAVAEFGEDSDEAKAALEKMNAAGDKAIEADKKQLDSKKKLIAGIDEAQGIFNAAGQGVMQIGDAFGGFDDATNDAIGDIMAIGNAAMDLGKSIASGDVAGMIKAGVQLIGSVFSALSGDKKRERNIKKWAAAVEELKNKYNELAYAVEKALGTAKYDNQNSMIKNLQQQQIALQKMYNEENSKKKKDQGKLNEYKEQIADISRQIQDITDDMISNILQTDVSTLADNLGDALLAAWEKGASGADAYKDVAKKAMQDAVLNALKMSLLEPQLKAFTNQMLTSMGYKVNSDGTVSGSFDGLTSQEQQNLQDMMGSIYSQFEQAMSGYTDLFGVGETTNSSLEGAVKGVSEETASVIAGQMNGIRVNQGEILAIFRINQQILQAQLSELSGIRENTSYIYNLYKTMDGLMAGLRAKGLV